VNEELYLPYGSAGEGPFSVSVMPGRAAGWGWAGLRVLELAPGGSAAFTTGEHEMIVLPLAGSAVVEADGEHFGLQGRRNVFSRVSDFAYVPPGTDVAVHSAAGGRFALPHAPASQQFPARYCPAEKVPVELRGAGQCSRQINNFATPDALQAGSLIACEVLTPAGNWSSYPPHKHDTYREGAESELEEIYYFEVAGDGGMAYQRVYGTSERPVDVLAEVRTGDVVLVPHGWHGPSMAVPGYDLYYLNVMAGPPQERAWRICDDPAHAWVRGTWHGQPADPRLPLTTASERTGD
jgi:5-deoxy-glucuronate isomerase